MHPKPKKLYISVKNSYYINYDKINSVISIKYQNNAVFLESLMIKPVASIDSLNVIKSSFIQTDDDYYYLKHPGSIMGSFTFEIYKICVV